MVGGEIDYLEKEKFLKKAGTVRIMEFIRINIMFFAVSLLIGCTPNKIEDERRIEFDTKLIGRWVTNDLRNAEIVFYNDSTYRIMSDFTFSYGSKKVSHNVKLDDRGIAFTKNNGVALIGSDAWLTNDIGSGELYRMEPWRIDTFLTYFSWKNLPKGPISWDVIKFNPDSFFSKIETDSLRSNVALKILENYSGNECLLKTRRLFRYIVIDDTLKTWSMDELIIWRRKGF
jgi:hypothetical protein